MNKSAVVFLSALCMSSLAQAGGGGGRYFSEMPAASACENSYTRDASGVITAVSTPTLTAGGIDSVALRATVDSYYRNKLNDSEAAEHELKLLSDLQNNVYDLNGYLISLSHNARPSVPLTRMCVEYGITTDHMASDISALLDQVLYVEGQYTYENLGFLIYGSQANNDAEIASLQAAFPDLSSEIGVHEEYALLRDWSELGSEICSSPEHVTPEVMQIYRRQIEASRQSLRELGCVISSVLRSGPVEATSAHSTVIESLMRRLLQAEEATPAPAATPAVTE